ncbi:MAG: hypothetical protein WCP35_15570 [Verrucomicrobiota bacterium]
MKTQLELTDTATTIEGAVIDPSSGRMCATAADIARGSNVSPSTIARISSARRYAGGRYIDIVDALAELDKTRRVGRPYRPVREQPHGANQTPTPNTPLP